ncbi:MAG: hypothetical protein WDW38_006439 [Sanguina aurantia]
MRPAQPPARRCAAQRKRAERAAPPREMRDRRIPSSRRAAPAAAPPAPAKRSYTVAKGDTLFSIAKKHSVEVAQLRDWNHLKDNNVKLGQSLRVGNR